MKMKAVLASALFALSACSYHVDKGGDQSQLGISGDRMGFSEASTILGPKCVSCHTHDHSWANNIDGVRARLDEIKARISSSDPGFMMPPMGAMALTPAEKTALLQWLDRGAPVIGGQTGPVQPPPPPPVPPSMSFAYVKQQVFSQKCLTCHRHADDFDTFAHAKPLLREMKDRIHATDPDDHMPPFNRPQLSADELKLLDDWIDAGAPENGPLLPSLSFVYLQQQVFGKKCATCHHHQKHDDFATYGSVKSILPEMQSRIHAFGTDDQMPPKDEPQLSAAELNLLDQWLNAKAPEVGPVLSAPPSPTPAPVPSPAPPPSPHPQPTPAPAGKFAQVKKQVFDVKCATCHHHQKHNDFATYANVKPLLSEMKSRIHAIGTDDQMPPADKPQLTPNELKLLDSWLNAGAPADPAEFTADEAPEL